MLKYIKLFLILLILFIINIYESESKEYYELPLDVYIVNNHISEKDIVDYINFSNLKFREYGILTNIYLNNLTFINIQDDLVRKYNLLFNITNYEKECPIRNNMLIELISKDKFEDSIIDVIYLKRENGPIGRANICETKHIALSKERIFWVSYNERNFLHELGHSLDLPGISDWSCNLMNEKKIIKLFKCINVNKNQLRIIINFLNNSFYS